MILNCRNVQLCFRQVNAIVNSCAVSRFKSSSTRTKSKIEDIPVEEHLTAGYLTRTLGCSHRKWSQALENNPKLKSLKQKDIQNSVESLKTLNYSLEDILEKPMILYLNALTLENRFSVLQECGFHQITISLLSKYVAVINKTVTILKTYAYLPYELDVEKQLKSCFTDVDLFESNEYPCNENMNLKLLRENILNSYLRARLDMNVTEIEKLWRVYGRVRHKAFKSVQSIIQFLIDDLNFPKERIIKNGFLLYADAANVRRIIKEIPKIDGQDMREIVYRRPKLLMSSCDALLKTLEHVKAYGIGEGAIIRCLEVLTLGPDTILERLREMNEIEEFRVLNTNPRILRLVHHQNKARLRLEYLNQLKVRCASLHILSCGSVAFAKFARDGSDRTKGRDIVLYLSNILGIDDNSIRTLLSRHPNWCHIPLIHVKKCYDYLIMNFFTPEEIHRNIHLLLYPIKRIEEKLFLLRNPDFLRDNLLTIKNPLDNDEILKLVLYYIESEFHFTGDGVWTDQHTHHVENFNNLLPDFLESTSKDYKYGYRPSNAKDGNSLPRKQQVMQS